MNHNFAHLHLHTDASLRDGLGTVTRLLDRAQVMGFKQVAMTDHGTLANAVTFNIEAARRGMKPVLGLEGYVEFDGVIGHITLLADGAKGWNSLLQLNNLSHESDFKQPAFSIDQLVELNSGLVCLTGCIASPFHRLSLDDAYRLGLRLKKAFGYRLFGEVMVSAKSLGYERSMRISSRLGLNCVITNDVHFPMKEDADVHGILTNMKSGFSYDSSTLYLQSRHELQTFAERLGFDSGHANEMILRAGNIARKLGAVRLAKTPHLPHVKSDSRAFWDGIKASGRAVVVLTDTEYIDRYRYEMEIIRDMGYEDYFIILDDIIKEAKRRGVKIGPGRGSGAGSLVLYLLGITDIDPIKYGLQFERFLNPERKGMPDVDVDIDSENRQKVLDYANDKYGAIPIATYSRYSHKSLTRDLGKMFRVDKKIVDKAAEGGDTCDAFLEIIDEHYPKFPYAYDAFMNQIRHKGKHAGGVIITETPVPVERISDGLAAAWTEGKNSELSYAGIVKFDLLGLSVLSALRRLEEQTGDKPEGPSDGAEEFNVFCNGNLSGIFQFAGSDGIKDLTIKLQPDTFSELIAINALYRPGAIDSGSMEKYPDWKKTPRVVPEYIADILEETYGAIVYQEQVMEIYRRTVGGSLAEADTARRIITKSKPSDPDWVLSMGEIKNLFIMSAGANFDLSFIDAQGLWGELETHSRYSFNKSHSTAYAMISWECAWWKHNYPTQFYAAMLNTDPQNEQTYIIDAVKYGIKVLPPHVNESTSEWVGKHGVIHMPLSAIKFMGKAGVDALVSEREAAGGKFDSIEHFMKIVPKRMVRARARAGLWSLGGFETLWEHLDEPEDLVEILSLKEMPMTGEERARHLKYLGFLIPNKEMLDAWSKLEREGWLCGVINSKDSRESRWGPYMVYRLSPSGVFWSRDVRDLQKGQVVAVKVNPKNGKAKKIKFI